MKPLVVLILFFLISMAVWAPVDNCACDHKADESHDAASALGAPGTFADQIAQAANGDAPHHGPQTFGHSAACRCLCHTSAITTAQHAPVRPNSCLAVSQTIDVFLSLRVFRIDRPPRLA